MNNSNTPSVNPDPSVLIVSGDTTVADSLNEMYKLGLKHALATIEESVTLLDAYNHIEKLLNNSK